MSLVKLVGNGIGFVSEAIAAQKARKAQSGQTGDPNAQRSLDSQVVQVSNEQHDALIAEGMAVPAVHAEQDEDVPENVEDEEDWQLDEASDHVERHDDSQGGKNPDVRKYLHKFLTAHPEPTNFTPAKLPSAVILPQRRPGTKSRGFVRAYAPVLEGAGIDQHAWMEFLETFEKSSEASPILTGIMVASTCVGFVPSITVMVTTTAIDIAAGIAMAVQSRSRTNTFLDDINKHFFRPRGLYALLIQYKDSRQLWSSGPLDVSHSVARSVTSADAPKTGNVGSKLKHNLKASGGKSHGMMEIPEAAPLVYPALDSEMSRSGDQKETFMQRFKSNTAFIQPYFDRRAQATFNQEHQGPDAHPLATPQPKFASKYADPTHPVNNGSLVSFVTGGRVDSSNSSFSRGNGPLSRVTGRMGSRNDDPDHSAYRGGPLSLLANGRGSPLNAIGQHLQQRRGQRGSGGPLGMGKQPGGRKRIMKEGVLYLMVVNMPSQEEIARAVAELEKQVKEPVHPEGV